MYPEEKNFNAVPIYDVGPAPIDPKIEQALQEHPAPPTPTPTPTPAPPPGPTPTAPPDCSSASSSQHENSSLLASMLRLLGAGKAEAQPGTGLYLAQECTQAIPFITASVTIAQSVPYFAGQTLQGSFTIANKGGASITFDELVLGGRLNGVSDCSNYIAGICPDFTKKYGITLAPGASYAYTGTFVPALAGTYDFQVFYRLGTKWYWNLPTDAGVKNQMFVEVGEYFPCETATGLNLPTKGTWRLNQPFGDYLGVYDGYPYNGHHGGEDWGGNPAGAPIYTAAPGKVAAIFPLGNRGQLVAIEHRGVFTIPAKTKTVNNGVTYQYTGETVRKLYSVYVHVAPKAGLDMDDCVQMGEQIATLSAISGPHLHFEIRMPTQAPSPKWSMVLPSENWRYYEGSPTGYYIDLQKMVDAGLRDPTSVLDANR